MEKMVVGMVEDMGKVLIVIGEGHQIHFCNQDFWEEVVGLMTDALKERR